MQQAVLRSHADGVKIIASNVWNSVVGGRFWGTTFVEPALVGDEYFMTKGHFHVLRDRSEYYVTTGGEGALILMDKKRQTRFELVGTASVRYIHGGYAHSVANTRSMVLSLLACWSSDESHDYDFVLEDGFSARLRRVDESPLLVREP
jgi:glucose-6-phosphate isomerase